MTQAVCIVCGDQKVGAWTHCPHCRFRPETVLELITALAFSDQGQYRLRLGELPRFVQQQIAALEKGDGSFTFDMSMIPLVERGLKDPSFRDVLTLKRVARDGLLSKQLNMHEVGPDGYAAHVLQRKRDIGAHEFDAIRSVGDGDLYVIVVYESGERQQHAVAKDRWYAVHDIMIITGRESIDRPVLQKIYEETCANYIERYLSTGTIL